MASIEASLIRHCIDRFKPLPSLVATPTYIIAADVVYDETLFQPLLATLAALA